MKPARVVISRPLGRSLGHGARCVILGWMMSAPGINAVFAENDHVQVRTRESQRIALIRQLTPSAVCLFGKENRAGGGSGVVIDSEGYGLTNYHVVAGMLPDRVGEGGLFDGNLYDMEVLGLDPTGDVAMFRLEDGAPFGAAKLGNSEELTVGEETLALGNPFLLAEDYTPTVTLGIISGLHRYQYGSGNALIYTDCIQVDASINPGNSGGPLFNMRGELIGINGRVSIEERGRVNVGVGYAISINQIKRFVPSLRAGLVVRHGAAGFTVLDLRGNVIIDKILEDSRAYAAGLRLEDQIVRFDGREIRTANQFLSLLGTYPSDWPVEVFYRRGDSITKVRFRLNDVPLPKPSMGRVPRGAKPPDPYAENERSLAANRRAVSRLLNLAIDAIGGRGAMEHVRSVSYTGQRRDPEKPVAEPDAVNINESVSQDTNADGEDPAAMTERGIRWNLWSGKSNSRDYRVSGSDLINGRVAAVLEHENGKVVSRIMLDDHDGRLLAVEFDDENAKSWRYEYDAHQRAGALRLPHKKVILREERVIAEETYSEITVAGH